VGHPSRHLDQALHSAERLRELEELRASCDCRGLLRRFGEERDHAAEVAHLARRDRVTRVRGKPGVEDLLDARVPREHGGDLRRVQAVLPHPERERLDPAQHEPGVERARYSA